MMIMLVYFKKNLHDPNIILSFILMLQIQRRPLKQILQNETLFWQEIESCIRNVNNQQILSPVDVEKLQTSKYPWNNIEQVQIIKDLRNLLLTHVEQSIYEIVGNQIVTLSNQLISLRNQLTDFALSQSFKNKEFQESVSNQVQQLKKKVSTNSAISHQKQLQGSKYAKSHNVVESKSVLAELSSIRSELEKVKDSSSIIDTSIFEGKIQMIESQITQLRLQTKMKMEEIKQKNNKIQHQVNQRFKDNGSKQLIASEVKACMKARGKVFSMEISQVKQQLQKIKQAGERGQLDIQNYISNQLKSLWVHSINLKRRIQKIQSQIDVVNASFIAD